MFELLYNLMSFAIDLTKKIMRRIYQFAFIALTFWSCSSLKTIQDSTPSIVLDTVEVGSDNIYHQYRASEKHIVDILHTKLEVSFNWDSTFLMGKASIDFRPYFYPTDSILLDAKGFEIKEIALLDGLGRKSKLNYTYDGLIIKVDLEKTYYRKDTLSLSIDYVAMPNKLKSGGSAAITNDIGLYFINPTGEIENKPRQIWTQGETESSSCWFPTVDAPNERCTQEMYITVDTIFKTLSNGELIFQTDNGNGTRTDYWKQSLPHAPYLFMLAIGEYAIVKDQWNDKAVNYYVEPQYKNLAKRIFPHTPEMLTFFSEKLQYQYPWDKFDQVVVRDYVSGAMENTSAVIYGEFVQGDERYLEDYNGEDIVAHEMFHHWFGDLVTCESWSNLPLNESFATYGEYLWNEYKHGKYTADYKLNNDLRAYLNEARLNPKSLIRFNYGQREEMFDRHSYQKGGRVLHMLRKQVGDDAFFKSLAFYLEKNEFTSVEIHDLRLAFEEVTGEDLNWFFNQWFLSPGHPILSSQWNYNDSLGQLNISIQQTQEGGNVSEIFTLPIEVAILDNANKISYKTIWLNQRTQKFELHFPTKPLLVNLDASKDLLLELDQGFSKVDAALLYQNFPQYKNQYLALNILKDDTSEESIKVFKDALEHDFWHMRYVAIKQIEPLVQGDSSNTLEKLIRLAENDQESNVRSAAYEAIGKFYAESFEKSTFEKGINDLSYRVAASTLTAYYKSKPQEALSSAKLLENEDNATLLRSIAGIYANNGDEKYSHFFTQHIENTNGFSKYQMIQLFGEFLSKQSLNEQKNALPLLFDLTGDELWYIRYGALLNMISLKSSLNESNEKLNIQLAKTPDSNELIEEQRFISSMINKIDAQLTSLKKTESNETLLKLLNNN